MWTTGRAITSEPTVAAPQFRGLGTIDQHRLVKAAVQERMDDGSIHALSLNTAPAEPSEPVTSEIESEG